MNEIHDELPFYGINFPRQPGPAVRAPETRGSDGAGPDFEDDDTRNEWDPVEELAQMLSRGAATGAGHDTALLGRPHRRRRNRRRGTAEEGVRKETHLTVLVVAITVCAVLMLGWSISYTYDQLRTIASAVLPQRLAQWWPLAVYGPWFVAALSILRATIQSRSTRRSWCVVLAASAMAVALCARHAPQAMLSLVIFGIPPVTAVVCLWELVGQVATKHHPRHAARRKGEEKD
ncbi:DUF2637 domain-containing protein [Streptomyces sp. NPDC002643]